MASQDNEFLQALAREVGVEVAEVERRLKELDKKGHELAKEAKQLKKHPDDPKLIRKIGDTLRELMRAQAQTTREEQGLEVSASRAQQAAAAYSQKPRDRKQPPYDKVA